MLEQADTRAVRRDATREKILKAAWKLARKEGLLSLSLRDLAKAVGMRAPSLYSYFDSKHAIYDAMFAQANRELVELLGSVEATELSDFLRQRSRVFIDFATNDPVRNQLLFQRTIPDFEPSEESYAIAVDLLGETQRWFVEAGFTDGRVVDLWTALTSGLVNQQLANDPGGDRWTRLLDETLEMFLQHIGYEKEGKNR